MLVQRWSGVSRVITNLTSCLSCQTRHVSCLLCGAFTHTVFRQCGERAPTALRAPFCHQMLLSVIKDYEGGGGLQSSTISGGLKHDGSSKWWWSQLCCYVIGEEGVRHTESWGLDVRVLCRTLQPSGEVMKCMQCNAAIWRNIALWV